MFNQFDKKHKRRLSGTGYKTRIRQPPYAVYENISVTTKIGHHTPVHRQ